MQRKTFWTSRETREYPMLRGRMTADVAIIGGGLSGLTVGLWLSRAGLRVALAEAQELGCGTTAHCAGIAGLTNGLLYAGLEKKRGAYAAQVYAQTQKNALNAVRELTRELGVECAELDAFLLVRKGGEERLEAEAEAMKRAGVAAGYEPCATAEGYASTGLRVRSTLVMHTAHYLHALARCLEENGGEIFEHSRVRQVEINEVFTERGTIQAPYLVVATGYPIVNTPGWYFLRMRQRQCQLVPLVGETTFHGVYAASDGSFALRPLTHGALLQCNGGFVGTGGTGRERALSIAKHLGMESAEEYYSSLECYTPDGLPFVGPYSAKTPNLFVASGYGGRGIVGSMVAAQAVSARILGLPAEGYGLYSGQRHVPSARMPLQIAGRYLHGMIARPSAPRCPHMGCRLLQNPASGLWECPCHGSRFDGIGHVINAPAVHDAMLENRR